MSRDWTPIDDDPRWENEDYYDQVKLELNALAHEWSRIHDKEEEDSFMMGDPDGWHQDDPELDAFFEASEKTHRMLVRAQIEAIENRLIELGARMMRPYEHWNEDERYMSYMENRGY